MWRLTCVGLREKMNDAWYEEVEARTRLTQGDLIFDCPLISWQPDLIRTQSVGESEALRAATAAIRGDVVVMTQACDLEYEKVSNVILCPHLGLGEYRLAWEAEMRRRNQHPTDKAWRKHCEDIRDGFVWNLTLLNAGRATTLSTEHRVVDFHDVYNVPRAFLESLIGQRGKSRLRLLPPYREHLSQAFARFFMRVGLPVEVAQAW